MSLTTITIGGVDYPSYATIDEADAYLAIDTTRAGAWSALDEAAKSQCLAAATRRLDGLPWAGRKTSESQITAWPRTGMKPEPSKNVPLEIEQACVLLAGDLAVTPHASLNDSRVQDVQSERVGPKSVSFFGRRRERESNTGLGSETAALVAKWLQGPVVATPMATGTDGESEFLPEGRYGRTKGIG